MLINLDFISNTWYKATKIRLKQTHQKLIRMKVQPILYLLYIIQQAKELNLFMRQTHTRSL